MDRLLTPQQVADLLQLKTKTIKDWLRSGRLRGIKTGSVWRVEQSAVDEYLKLQRYAQELELKGRVQTETARQLREGGEASTIGIVCDECDCILIANFYDLTNEAAKGNLPACPECGAQVGQDIITKNSAIEHIANRAREQEEQDNQS